MIEVKNITKKFGDFTAIEDVSLTVDNGSIFGIVGYNGAGKTTLLKACAGIYKAEKGQVLIDGEDVFDNGRLRERLFFIPDELYFPRGANLEKMRSFYKGYYPDFSDAVFTKMADVMGLDRRKSLQSFSKGMQRQAEIVLALASRPKYMLLDEVFDGVDPQKRELCKNIFIEYMAETDCSILMSSHNLQELANLCDRVALLNGKGLALNVTVDDAGSAYKKYRLIFDREISADELEGIPCRDIKIDGKMVVVITDSAVDEGVFGKLNPIHIDSVMLSVEEVLLNEMEDREYDISSIFSE